MNEVTNLGVCDCQSAAHICFTLE